MPFTAVPDKSRQKVERRRTTYKLVRRNRATNILATNFPEEFGRKFVHKLAALGASVTLVEKKNFSRVSQKELSGVATLMPHTDVFFQMLSNKFDFLDLDLCGGLAYDDVRSIEACTSWKTVILTVTNKFRSKFGKKPATPKGVHIQAYMFELCERNGWGCQLSFSPKPYQRPNKRAVAGIPDKRSPWYYTFVITRQ